MPVNLIARRTALGQVETFAGVAAHVRSWGYNGRKLGVAVRSESSQERKSEHSIYSAASRAHGRIHDTQTTRQHAGLAPALVMVVRKNYNKFSLSLNKNLDRHVNDPDTLAKY